MVRHYYKEALDYAVVDILDRKYPVYLRYNELVQEMKASKEIGWKRDTLSNRGQEVWSNFLFVNKKV